MLIVYSVCQLLASEFGISCCCFFGKLYSLCVSRNNKRATRVGSVYCFRTLSSKKKIKIKTAKMVIWRLQIILLFMYIVNIFNSLFNQVMYIFHSYFLCSPWVVFSFFVDVFFFCFINVFYSITKLHLHFLTQSSFSLWLVQFIFILRFVQFIAVISG